MTVCDQLKLKSEEEDYVSLEDVYAIAMDAGIECSDPSAVDPLQRNWDEVNAMLYHFHQLGVIVYYGEHQCLDQCIILNPQWIVDRITDVIREYSCVQYSHTRLGDKIAKTLEFQWLNLTKEGILSKRLLRYLWRGNQSQTQFLLKLMQHFCLICPVKIPKPGSVLMEYLVPNLLPTVDFPLQRENADAIIAFNFLPNGFFGRLIVLAFEYYFSESTLFQNNMDLDEHEHQIDSTEEILWSDTINAFCDTLEGSDTQGKGRLVNKTWVAFTIKKNKGCFRSQ